MMSSIKYNLTVIIIFLALNFIPSYSVPFISEGEPREALVVVEMINENDWILPTRYDDELPAKPPFMHWISASISVLMNGVNEFTTRFPSLFFSLMILLVLFNLVKNEISIKHAFFSVFILGTSFLWLRSTNLCRVDMTLSGLLFISWVYVYKIHKSIILNKSYLLILLIALSAATLTKGPVAIILTISIYSLIALTSSKLSKQLNLIIVMTLIAISVTISLVWYIAAYYQEGERFLNLVYNENVARFLSTMDKNLPEPHEHSFLYNFGTLITGMMPWSLFFLIVLGKTIWNYKHNVKDTFIELNNSIFKRIRNANDLISYSILVCFVVFFFYCIPASKRAEYLLPIYPFIAILLAHFILQSKIYYDNFISFVKVYSNLLIALNLIAIALVMFIKFWHIDYVNIASIQITNLLIITAIVLILSFFRVKFISDKVSKSLIMIIINLHIITSFLLPLISMPQSPYLQLLEIQKKIDLNEVSTYGKKYAYQFYSLTKLKTKLNLFKTDYNINEDIYLLLRKSELDDIENKKNTLSDIIYGEKNYFRKESNNIVVAKLKSNKEL